MIEHIAAGAAFDTVEAVRELANRLLILEKLNNQSSTNTPQPDGTQRIPESQVTRKIHKIPH